MNFLELEQKINKNKPLDFGDVFSKSIELFKKVWLQGLIQYILTGVLMIPIVLVLYIPMMMVMIPLGLMNENIESFEELSLGLGIVAGVGMFVLYIIAIVLMFSVQLIMRAAFYKICKDKDANPNVSSDEYFFYFKKKYLKKIIVLSFISIGAIVLGMICFVIPALILMVPLSYLSIVFAFNPELSAKEIFKTALKLGMKKWWITVFLLIVASFLATFVGFLACFVGVYVTASFVYLPTYFVYEETVGFGKDSSEFQEIEQIGEE